MDLWERQTERAADRVLDLLDSHKYGEMRYLKAQYAVRTLIGEMEKLLILAVIFFLQGQLDELAVLLAVIIPLRCCTGGTHRKTMCGCFLQTLILSEAVVMTARYIRMESWMLTAVFLYEFLLAATVVPIQSRNRIHYDRKQRQAFQKKEAVMLFMLFAATVAVTEDIRNVMAWTLFLHMSELTVAARMNIRKETVSC